MLQLTSFIHRLLQVRFTWTNVNYYNFIKFNMILQAVDLRVYPIGFTELSELAEFKKGAFQ